MISDAALVEVFRFELERSRSLEAAVRAIRLAVEVKVSLRERRRRAKAVAPPRPPRPRGPRTQPGPRSKDVPAPAVEAVLRLVAADARLEVKEVLRGTTHHAFDARRVAAGVLRSAYDASLWAIARALGLTDHTRPLKMLQGLEDSPELEARRARVLATLTNVKDQEAAA